MIELVVNADDLGLHPAIDEGILRAHREGIVTSATLLATARNAAAAVPRAKAAGLALGVHLCVSSGLPSAAPPEEIPTVAPGGRLRRSWAAFALAVLAGRVRLEQVARELKAQIARARQLGAEPDHLDGHQHLHVLPGMTGIVAGLAREEGLGLRWPAEGPRAAWLAHPAPAAKAALLSALAAFRKPTGVALVSGVGVFETNRVDPGNLLAVLERLGPGRYDLCCHPGLNPDELPEDPGWRFGREAELAALCDPRVREAVERRGIRLTTYRALAS